MNHIAPGPIPSPAPRFAFYYGAVFLVAGVHLPFWPLWLDSKGLSANDIALFLAATTWARVLATPLAGGLADSVTRLQPLLLAAAFGSLGLVLLMQWVSGFWPLLILQLLGFALFYPLIPLGETQAMRAARRRGMDYGRVRLWGSLSFILAVLLAGPLIEASGPSVILWLIAVGIAASGIAVWFLPLDRVQTGPEPRRWLKLVKRPGFLWLLLAGALLQASHAVYYAFSALDWRAAGYSEGAIGLLWALGVIAEVLLFFLGRRLLRRFPPFQLLLIAALAGLARWSLLGASDALALLLAAQSLHAITFGAAHLGVMHLLSTLVPEQNASSAQSLYSAAVGASMGLLTLLAGPLYGALAAEAYYAMALLSLAALLACWRLKPHLVP